MKEIEYSSLEKELALDVKSIKLLIENDFIIKNVKTIGQAWYVSDIAKELNINSTLHTSMYVDTIFFSKKDNRMYWCFPSSKDRFINYNLYFKNENDDLISLDSYILK